MKETRLEDDAAIYSRREARTEKEKWSLLSKKGKIQYFTDYYLKYLIGGILLIALIGSFVYSMVTKKTPAFTVCIVDGALSEEEADALGTTLGKVLEINPAKEEVLIDQSLSTSSRDGETLSDAAVQKLSVYSYSQSYDLLIAQEPVASHYAGIGYFLNMETILSNKVREENREALVYTEVEGVSVPYGIRLEALPALRKVAASMKHPTLVVLASTARREAVGKVLSYLLHEKDDN